MPLVDPAPRRPEQSVGARLGPLRLLCACWVDTSDRAGSGAVDPTPERAGECLRRALAWGARVMAFVPVFVERHSVEVIQQLVA